MTREGHKAASECGKWKVTSDFLMATNTNVCPLAALPDFSQNMAYKISDNLSTLSISHFDLLDYM